MMKRLLLLTITAACTLTLKAQSSTLTLTASIRQTCNLKKWGIPPGNYSGITPLGDNRYAVVTDKPTGNGFYEFEIILSPKGKVASAQNLGFRCDSIPAKRRDMEGIVFLPSANSVFISAENDQEILEYSLDGQLTGRRLDIPEAFGKNRIQRNYGFEALAYSPDTHLFWTTTENALLADKRGLGEPVTLRLQSFDEALQPVSQYEYQTDAPTRDAKKHRFYCFGVPEITALPDSSLLILERELYVPKRYFGAFVTTKIYRTKPSEGSTKTLVTSFRTHLRNLSNYEGMCLGPVLPDGRQTLLLICDSQDRFGNMYYHLKDRLRVLILK